MIESDFKYFVNSFILENLMYFISLKASVNCGECRDGFQQNSSHRCFRVGYRFHERRDILYYFNEAISDAMDVLTMDVYLADIQNAIYNNLLKLNYPDYEIYGINSIQNIVSTIRSEQSVIWCFDQLWWSHPDDVFEIPIPPVMGKSPTAANGCYMLNGATPLSATPVSTVQPVGATSTAEAVGTAFSVLNSGVSPDDEVKIFIYKFKCSECHVILNKI